MKRRMGMLRWSGNRPALGESESKIWLVGGMLVVCLAMMVSLCIYIMICGLSAFWPRPIDLIVNQEGSLLMGQLIRRTQAREFVDPSVPISHEQWYYSVCKTSSSGNQYAATRIMRLDPLQVGHPVNAVWIERLGWGKLYGFPTQLSEEIPLPAGFQEEISQLTQLREILVARGAQRQLDNPLIGMLDAAMVAKRDQALRTAISRGVEFAPHLLVQTAEGATILPPADYVVWLTERANSDESDSGSQHADFGLNRNPLLSARWVWQSPGSIFQAIGNRLSNIEELRHSENRIRKELGRLDQELVNRQKHFAQALAQSKLEAHDDIENWCVSFHEKIRLTELLADAVGYESLLVGLSDDEVEWQIPTRTILGEYQDSLTQQVEILDRRLKNWWLTSGELPSAWLPEIEEFQAFYLKYASVRKSRRREFEEIQNALKATRLRLAYLESDEVRAVPQTEAMEVLHENLSKVLGQEFKADGIEAGIRIEEREEVAADVSLMTIVGPDGQRRLCAVRALKEKGETASDSGRISVLSELEIPAAEIERCVAANRLSWSGKAEIYLDCWREFLLDPPREANTAGGMFPAIWGTTVLTLIMTVAVVPLGVVAALYLREYTSGGPLVSMIRTSICNLAGVPSIVYGVFGMTFFCYTLGAFLDGGPANAGISPLPPVIWFLVLGITVVVGTVAFHFTFLFSRNLTGGSGVPWQARLALCLWLASMVLSMFLVLKSPFFDGFFREGLPNPTFGKGGVLWAALTLALLTLPIVIVSTEEALAAVPNSLREASTACGASQWQTIRNIVIPYARPGILTGGILAMARGVGQVAPLMLVGALPSVPDLPLDAEFPYLHGSRSFMHLGYEIYTLGFQSQDSEATRPLVFACMLLLVIVVSLLNLTANLLRTRMRARIPQSHF